MSKSRKGLWFLSVTCLAVISTFIFGKTLCWKGVEYLVHKTDPNAKVQAEQMTFGKKGLCLHNLSLEGTFGHVDVEKMHLGLRLHLKKMAIQPTVILDHLVWDVPESLGEGAKKRSLPTVHVEVLGGQLRRGEHTLSVNFTSGQSKADLGLVELSDGAIEVMLKMLPEGLVAISRFHHADLGKLAPFGDLFPTSWIPEQGQIAGHLTAQWDPSGQLSEVGGDIKACDLKLWHPHRKLQFGAKNLDWKGDFPKGVLQVEDGYLLALSKRLPAQWGLRLSGGVEKGKIALTGCMVREGEVFPIAIAGQGKIGKDTSLQATFHVSGEGQSTISVTMKPQASVFRGRFQEISSKQLLLFRDGLGAFFPVFRDLELEGAKLNAELIAHMQKGTIRRLEVENISSETMWLKWPSHQIEGKGKNLKLSGTLPFEEGPLWKKAVWNVAIDQGQIQDFEDVSIRFFVEGENIQHGMASGKWHALEVEGEINGTLLHPQIALNAWGTTQKLAKILEVEPKGDQPLTLRALIDRKNMAWNAAGHLKAGEGELTFGTIFELKKHIPRGWVEGENISSAVYDLAIKALEMPFTIDGDIHLSGTIDPTGCQISVNSALLHYTSNDLDIEFPHLGKTSALLSESAQHATLSYQAKTKNWEVIVPLLGAKLKDKTYGFQVEGINGLAIFNDKRLTSQNLKAKVHGLDLCLDLSLEIKEPGKADLHISASEMAGDISGLMDVLRHFDKFKSLKLPLTGQIQHIDNSPFSLFSPLGQPEKKTAYSAHLKLIDGSYAVTEHFVGNALSCEMKITSENEILEIHALDGDLLLTDGDHQSRFEISAPDLRLIDMDHGDWEFDLRIESQTHDLMRLSGALDHTHGLKLDETKSHLFGEKLYIEQLKLEPFAFQGRTVLKLQKIDTALRFLKALALVDVHGTTIGAIQKTDLKGDLSVNLTYHNGEFNIESDGRDLKVKHWCIPRFSLKMAHEGHLLSLDHLMIGDFQVRALAEKRATQWDLSLFEIDWQNTQFQTFEGYFTDDTLTLMVNSAQIDLDHLRPLFFEEKNPYFQGLFDLTGNVTLNISNWDIEGQFQLFSDNFTSANIEIKTLAPFEFSFNRKTGIALSGALLDLAGSEIQIEHLGYDKTIGQWFCHGLALSIAPEMVYFLAEKELIPYLEKHKEQLFIRGIPIHWDNHLETTLELCYSPKSFSLSATLKDGYYWIGDVSCYLKNGTFIGRNTGLTFQAESKLNNAAFSVWAELPFDATQEPRITLNDHSELSEKPLTVCFSRDPKAIIKYAKGSFCGFDVDFHHNPSLQKHPLLGLTGDVSIDWSLAAKLLPESLSQGVQDYDMGRGYKLTGDLSLNMAAPAKSTFKGYFKGKDFELLGYKFKSLLSQIEYSADYLLFEDFSLSDEAIALKIPHVNIAGKNISIPTLKIQDLRPSLLQKCGKLPGRLKPFVIKNLEFHKIAGTLGDRKSFSGKGNLQFINTFKRDVTLFDIPKDLFSRIGLDVGLLIPVCGELMCELDGTRVHFTKLTNTYSDGERSQFFLSKKKPSYIDLDGQIHIDIRMKQFVLLKVTQPFVLSIRGTLDHPKFSLQ